MRVTSSVERKLAKESTFHRLSTPEMQDCTTWRATWTRIELFHLPAVTMLCAQPFQFPVLTEPQRKFSETATREYFHWDMAWLRWQRDVISESSCSLFREPARTCSRLRVMGLECIRVHIPVWKLLPTTIRRGSFFSVVSLRRRCLALRACGAPFVLRRLHYVEPNRGTVHSRRQVSERWRWEERPTAAHKRRAGLLRMLSTGARVKQQCRADAGAGHLSSNAVTPPFPSTARAFLGGHSRTFAHASRAIAQPFSAGRAGRDMCMVFHGPVAHIL